MINVNETTKNAYISATHKNVTITFPSANVTFTNSDLVEESLELTETIETERNLTFKGCIASQFRFKVADIVQDLRGQYLEAFIQADNTQTIPLFKGYVDTQDNMTHEDIITEFTCYDPLYKIGSRNMQSWVDSRTYPITVKNFRNQLFSALGITQEAKTLVNDGWSIQEEIKGFVDEPSAVDLMRWICQLNGVFGQYGRDGKFHYREIKSISEGTYPAEDLFPSTTTFPAEENAGALIATDVYNSLKYEPYNTEAITKVAIIDAGGIDQGQAGSGSNVFTIQDNPIAFNIPNMRAAASALLSKIGGIDYTPVVGISCVGMPWLECGDSYLTFTNRNAIRTYILQRTFKGIQALYDEYSSDTDSLYPPYKSTSTTRFNEDKKSILKINADITELDELVATKATIEQLEAVDGKFKNLNADYITTGTIKPKRIGENSIGVEKLSGSIEGNDGLGLTDWEINLTNGTMTIGEINANKIQAGTIDAKRIGANTIGVEKLTGSITDTASTPTWEINLKKGTMTIGEISVGKVKGSIKDNSTTPTWEINFNTGKMKIGEISADKITSGTIKTERLSSDVITTSNFSAQSIDADMITAGTLKVGRIEEYNPNTQTGGFSSSYIRPSAIINSKLADSSVSGGKLLKSNGNFDFGGNVTITSGTIYSNIQRGQYKFTENGVQTVQGYEVYRKVGESVPWSSVANRIKSGSVKIGSTTYNVTFTYY